MEGGRDEGESYDGPVKELLVLPLHSEEEHVDDSRMRGACWKGQSPREAGGCSGRPAVGVWKLVLCECRAHGGGGWMTGRDKATEQCLCRGALRGDRSITLWPQQSKGSGVRWLGRAP